MPLTLRSCLLALCCAACMGAQAQAPADERSEIDRMVRAGDTAGAMQKIDATLAGDPRNAPLRFMKAVLLAETGRRKEAIELYLRLTQEYPELPEPYNNLAVIYASQGQYEKARSSLEQSIRTHPSYATAYENLGDVYAKLASQAYDNALQLDSSNTGAQNKLSLVRDLVGGPTTVASAKEPAKPAVVLAQKTPEKAVEPKSAPAEKPAEKAAEKPAEKPVEKPAAKAPAENPAAKAAAADASAEIVKTLNAWAQAWSKKDADAYLAHYAGDFVTPGGEPRADWEKARRARIAAPKSIAVSVSSAKVTMQGPDKATVTFRQAYKSDVMKANSPKTVIMTRSDGRWLIQQEKAGK